MSREIRTKAACPCGAPAPNATICPQCTRDLQTALITAALIEPDLTVAITRQARFAERTRHASGSVLPYDQRASDAAASLRRTLAAWLPAVPPANDAVRETIGGMASWLLRHTPALANHPQADTAQAQITEAVRDASRAIDRPPGRHYAGPCDDCGTDLLTKGAMRTVACRVCGAEYDVATRQEWMRAQLEDHLGNASYVAAISTALGLRVSPAAVRMWASRRKLEVRHYAPPRTAGKQPSPLYRLGDVLDLALARDVRRSA